jgi:hypothetical protein
VGVDWFDARVLAPRDDPTTLDFFSSCETLSVVACLRKPDILNGNG